MELMTPLGAIQVLLDDTPIPCSATQLEPNKEHCPDVAGRYRIDVDYLPDGKEHLISCCLYPSQPITREPEHGERLECYGYYNENRSIKVSVGMEAETELFYSDRGELIRENDNFDYESEFSEKDGAFYNSYVILSSTKTTHYVFGIAWIFDCTNVSRDTQTWFGADPVTIRFEGRHK